jgi:hypothetical protein
MKFLLKFMGCLLVCGGVTPVAHAAFSLQDIQSLASRPVSYFQNPTPPVDPVNPDGLLQPYLDAINTVITPTAPGGAHVMILDVHLLPTDNQRNVSTFAQLLAAIHGYGGPLVTSDTIEALAEVTQLKSAVNTGINAVNAKYNQPPTTSSYTILFGGGAHPFSTIGNLAAAYSGVMGTLNENPYFSYIKPYAYAYTSYATAKDETGATGVSSHVIPSGPTAGFNLILSSFPTTKGQPAPDNLSDFLTALRLQSGATSGSVPSIATTSDLDIQKLIANINSDLNSLLACWLCWSRSEIQGGHSCF